MVWQRSVVTSEFISESCCFADVDGDGVLELVAGPYWWRLDDLQTAHRFREVERCWLPDWPHDPSLDPHPSLRRGSGEAQYRASTYDWPCQLSEAAGSDVVSVGMHQDPVVWHENPGQGQGPWERHVIASGGIYESAVFLPEGPTRRPALVTVPRRGAIAWYEPPANPRRPWLEYEVGPEGGDWHGLGVGDIDGDGRDEILCRKICYRQSDDPRAPWVAFRLWQIDEQGNRSEGLGDVFIVRVVPRLNSPAILVSASPHKKGIWVWELEEHSKNGFCYRRRTLDSTVSQVHSLRVEQILDSGSWSIICGKRWQAHGADSDADPRAPPVLLALHSRSGTWSDAESELIDSTSGVGIHFDVDGSKRTTMIATSNKMGVHVFSQLKS